jgi:hypothetical protein
MIRQLMIMLSLFIPIGISCSGGGAETPNSINHIEISSVNGILSVKGHHGVKVRVFSSTYVPYTDSGFSRTTYINSNGDCRIDSLITGNYFLLVEDTLSNTNSFIADVIVAQRNRQYISAELDSPSVFKCKVLLDSSDFVLKQLKDIMNYVPLFCPGTPWYSKANNSGEYVIGNIASGTYTIQSPTIALIINYPDSLHKTEIHSYRISSLFSTKPDRLVTMDSLRFFELK